MPSNSDRDQLDLVITGDGSHTLFSHRFNQYYHNPNGSVAESRHVFFETSGLTKALTEAKQINILEAGFGTGLNLLLLLDEYLNSGSKAIIRYHSIEGYPIAAETAASFNYGNYLHHPELAEKVAQVFDSLTPGMNAFAILPEVQVHVFCGMFQDYNPGEFQADYVFHDAFSPEVNEELWTGESFKKVKTASSSDALLTTYCAASKARGAMAWAGWFVARAQGALGKREMTIASPNPDQLKDFKRVNEERLAKRYEQDDF